MERRPLKRRASVTTSIRTFDGRIVELPPHASHNPHHIADYLNKRMAKRAAEDSLTPAQRKARMAAKLRVRESDFQGV